MAEKRLELKLALNTRVSPAVRELLNDRCGLLGVTPYEYLRLLVFEDLLVSGAMAREKVPMRYKRLMDLL